MQRRHSTGQLGIGSFRRPEVKTLKPGLHAGVRLGGMGVAIGTTVGRMLADLAMRRFVDTDICTKASKAALGAVATIRCAWWNRNGPCVDLDEQVAQCPNVLMSKCPNIQMSCAL